MTYISGGGRYRGRKIQAWRAHLKAERRVRKQNLAECLSQGYTMSAAARKLGFSQQLASSLFAEIREDLGEI